MTCLVALSMTAMQGCADQIKEADHEASVGDTLVVVEDAEFV